MTSRAEAMEDRMENLERRVAALEEIFQRSGNTLVVASSKKTQSPKEFILERKPRDDVEATFLFGCYMEYVRKFISFNANNIRELFQEARMPVPLNVNDKVNKNIEKGLFTIAPHKKDGTKTKAWMVTLTGEQHFNTRK